MRGVLKKAGPPPQAVITKLAKPPKALALLLARPQWCVWRWEHKNDRWQKPPFVATDRGRHASSADPADWCDYKTALAVVQENQARGVTYMLTPEDPFGAIDLDHCRNLATGAIIDWAQQFIDQAAAIPTYVEITPSGVGLRIWGTVSALESLHTNKLLDAENEYRIELFRRTRKPLTVTGLQLGECKSFGNIDALLDHAAPWAEQYQTKPAKSSAGNSGNSQGNGSSLSQLSIDQIELIVREGAPPWINRSDVFHAIVGHYAACGWSGDQIVDHLEQYPNGVGDRYLAEGRLHGEVNRCLLKWQTMRLAQVDTWATAWQEEAEAKAWREQTEAKKTPKPETEAKKSEPEEQPQEPQPEAEEPEEEDDSGPQLALPPMFCHGDPDPRPIAAWLIKNLIAAVSFGLLSGQWGTGKTFLVFELSARLMTGQPFIGHSIKRQCGVMYIAAEGTNEVRKRLEAVVRYKCSGVARAPFRWYEASPTLLGQDAVPLLTAMAKQAADLLRQEFGLPLGLIVIDTIAASAGYKLPGAENDTAMGAQIMRVLQQVAQAHGCVVLGVDHFGKNIDLGTRGTSSKEANAELVLACLGDREVGGRVVNTRLAIRKNRTGPQAQEFAFSLRVVELGLDEDGEAITTMVVEWQTGPADTKPSAPGDPWQQSRQAETRQAMLLLKRVLMSVLAKEAVDLPIEPEGPTVRMINKEIAREEFYARTPADGTQTQKNEYRKKRFQRALNYAQEKQLIGIREIKGTTYLWLMPNQPEPDEEF